MNAKRGASILHPRLVAILLAIMCCVAGETVFAQGSDEPKVPTITKHPTPLSTNPKNSRIMLYAQATPNDEGALTYQWYMYGPDNAPYDYLADEGRREIQGKSTVQAVPNATHFTLDIDQPVSPSQAGIYYYWCKITNSKGGTGDDNLYFRTTNICKVVIVDRELPKNLENGEVEEWESYYLGDGGYAPSHATQWYVMDARYKPENAWYTTHTDRWSGFSGGEGIGTFEAVSAEQFGVRRIVYDGYMSNTQKANVQLGNLSCELSADVPSSNYQDIATTSGKIYEWEFVVGARNGTFGSDGNEAIALIIGPAINDKTDYGDFEGAQVVEGGTTSTNFVYPAEGNNIPNSATTYPRTRRLNTGEVIYRWVDRSAFGVQRPTNRKKLLTGEHVYRYGMDLNGSETETVANGTRVKMPTYFNDILKKVADENFTNFNLANRYDLKSKAGQSLVVNYNNRNYYVAIATAHKAKAWTYYSGVYSVPVGQGTTVFAFAYIPVGTDKGSANGNLFDNVKFERGQAATPEINMSYSGHVTVSIETRPDYVYGIAEVRGSAVYDITETVTIKGSDTPLTAANLGEQGTGHWFQVPGGQTIEFNNMTPGKTYRVVGIPRGAVSGTDKLNTNTSPSKVLDDGYYTEVTIQASYLENTNDQMSTIGVRDESIFLTNSNGEVDYALLDAGTLEVVCEWTPGKGLSTGQALFFNGLERDHCYIVVARPSGWNEVTYEMAAANGLEVCTPSLDMNDIRETQVIRYRDPITGVEQIIVRDANDKETEQIEHALEKWDETTKTGNKYVIYDGQTGVIHKTPTDFVTRDGVQYLEFDEALEKDAIYHIAVKPEGLPVYLTGVRIYPFVKPYFIHYVDETVGYGETRDGLPNTSKEIVRYNMRADNAAKTSLMGDTLITAQNDFIYLGVGNPTILDQMQTLQSNAYIESCLADLWPAAKFPSVFPMSEFEVPQRPDAPRPNNCEVSTDTGYDYFVDYVNEKITVPLGKNLAYSLNKGVTYTPINGAGEVTFAALGWSGAEVTVPLRIPAVDSTIDGNGNILEEGHFASEVNQQILPERGPAPKNVHAFKEEANPGKIKITGTGLTKGVKYEYRPQGTGDWAEFTPTDAAPDCEVDVVMNGEVEVDYEIRFAATLCKPASMPLRLSMPLTMVPFYFETVAYGYDSEALSENIEIVNVGVNEEQYIDGLGYDVFVLSNLRKNGEEYTDGDIFKVSPGTNRTVAAGGSNKASTIKPVEGLSVGAYSATLTLNFTDWGNARRFTTIDVAINVIRAPRENTLTIERLDPLTDLKVNIHGEDIESFEQIAYKRRADSDYRYGDPGDKDVEYTFPDLLPESEYTVQYRIAESENYEASEVKEQKFRTAYAPVDAIHVNYISEYLVLNDGCWADQYEIKVNGEVIDNMPYRLTEGQLGGEEIAVEVRRTGPDDYPPSVPHPYSFDGRGDAPGENVIVDKDNKRIYLAATDPIGVFQYRVEGGSRDSWIDIINPDGVTLDWGTYQVRYPAVDKVSFASKYTTVRILPPLKPDGDGNLYVNIDAATLVDGYTGDGSSWKNATPSLSAAMAYAKAPDNGIANTIHVAMGTYPPLEPAGSADKREYTYTLPSNVTIIGGYSVKAITGEVNEGVTNNPSILLGEVENAPNGVYHVVNADGATNVTLKNFVIAEGEATGDPTSNQDKGAGIYLTNSSKVTLINVLIRSNVSSGNGGGMYIEAGCEATLLNVTVAGNQAGTYNENKTVATPGVGGGIYNRGTLETNNTIVYRNLATGAVNGEAELFTEPTATFDPYYSLVRGMKLKEEKGQGNLDDTLVASNDPDESPLFIAPGVNNYHLIYGSIAQNVGSNGRYEDIVKIDFSKEEGKKEKDMAGRYRLGENTIDLGAYETQPLYILPDASGRMTNNSPISGGATVILQSYDLYGVNLDHVTVEVDTVKATFANGKRAVEADGIITVITRPSKEAKKCVIKLIHHHDGRVWDVTEPRSFTYFPVVFKEDGKWSEPYRWEGQTGDLIIPGDEYPNPITHIQIEANCRQDVNITAAAQMKEITVHTEKSYTIMNDKTLTAGILTLEGNASFLPNNGTLNVEKQIAKQTLGVGRNWYMSNPLDMTATEVEGRGVLQVNKPEMDEYLSPTILQRYNETTEKWEKADRAKGETKDLPTGRGHVIRSDASDMDLFFTGKYNNGDVRGPVLTKTAGEKSGFNLVGNPFPSYWQWSTSVAESAGVYSTIWYRTYVNGVYEFWSYNAAGNVGVAPGWDDATPTGSYSLRYVPPMQAFWVRVKENRTPGTLIFNNDNRTHADHGSNVMVRSLKDDEDLRPLLRLCAESETRTDETVIYADPSAKTTFDDYDSEKWFVNTGAEIYSLPEEPTHDLVINALPAVRDNTEVTLGFNPNAPGTYNIYAKELANLDHFNVYLRDKLSDLEFDLRTGPYNFSTNSLPTTNRFSIVFRSIYTDPTHDGLTAYVDTDGNVVVTLHLKEEKGQKATVSVYDTAGRKTAEQTITIGESTVIKQPLPRGVYIVKARKYTVKLVKSEEI